MSAYTQSIGTFAINVTVIAEEIINFSVPSNGKVCSRTPVIMANALKSNARITVKGLSAGVMTIVAQAVSNEEKIFVTEINKDTPLDTGLNTLLVYSDNDCLGRINLTIKENPSPDEVPCINGPYKNEIMRDKRPSVTGQGKAGKEVILYAKCSDNKILIFGTDVVSPDGSFSVTPSRDFSNGKYFLFTLIDGAISAIIPVIFIDPYGIVYDAETNKPIEGALITLERTTDNGATWYSALPGVDIASNDINPQVTGIDGLYSFLAADNASFRLSVSKAGYRFPSNSVSFGNPHLGSHGELFTISGVILNIDLPMDFIGSNIIKVSKKANKKEVNIGEVITYTVTIKNETSDDITGIFLDDSLAPGFKYIENRVILDNTAIPPPAGNSVKRFNIGKVLKNSSRELRYQVVAGTAVTFGKYTNKAWCVFPNERIISNTSEEEVIVVPCPIFDLSTIIGKVFYDADGDSVQDNSSEPGIPFARIIMEDGTIVLADKHGLFHIPGVTPGRHLARLDESSLPKSFFAAGSNMRLIDSRPGMMGKVNFPVSTDMVLADVTNINSSRSVIRSDFLSNECSMARGSSNTHISNINFEEKNKLSKSMNTDSFLFVGLADLEGGYTSNKGAIEPLVKGDKFKDGFWKDGKIAYYLKRKIMGKYLVTSSLDTTRARKDFFKIIDPKKYYPVYGDASKINYDADNTRGIFYCLIEWDKSKALFGNYKTEFNDTELIRYNRPFYGAKVHYESVTAGPSPSGVLKPNIKLIVFKAITESISAHNEFIGTGGSLYYLKHRDIIEGSESVNIEVRDNVSGILLDRVEQVRGEDYHIDYSQGRILFWKPVSQIVSANSIISKGLLNGNPVYVAVDYEYEPIEKYNEGTFGARFSKIINKNFEIGGTYVTEEYEAKIYKLLGFDTCFRLNPDTSVKAEYAESFLSNTGNFLSSDGGVTFSELEQNDLRKASAYLLKGKTIFLGFDVDGYYQIIQNGFYSQSIINSEGSLKYGIKIKKNINDIAMLLRYDSQTLVDYGNLVSRSQINAGRADSVYFEISKPISERLKLTGAYRRDEFKNILPEYRSKINIPGDITALRAEYKLTDKVIIEADTELPIRGGTGIKTGIGLRLAPNESLELSAKEIFSRQGPATSFGASYRPQNKKKEFFIDRTIGAGLSVINSRTAGIWNTGNSTSFGMREDITDKQKMFNYYTISNDPFMGEKVESSSGTGYKINDNLDLAISRDIRSYGDAREETNILGLNAKTGENMNVNFALEKGKVYNIDGTIYDRFASSYGMAFKIPDKLKFSNKFEIRLDDNIDEAYQYLFYSALEYMVNENLTLFTDIKKSKTDGGSIAVNNGFQTLFTEITSGVAYRPLNNDRLNFIGKASYLDNIYGATQKSFSNMDISAERAILYSAEGIYDVNDKIQLTEKLAWKIGAEKVSGFDYIASAVWLWINRVDYNFYKNFGAGFEYRVLNALLAKDFKQGILIELTYDIGENLQAGIGYNFTDFSDNLSSGNNYKASGIFFRITGKFDETLFIQRRGNKPFIRKDVAAVADIRPARQLARCKKDVSKRKNNSTKDSLITVDRYVNNFANTKIRKSRK
ncbi:protein containing DUF11 [Candidatus Omnitrophus magneticus]|uniref:Protein containing DUF11 n=1 Tax=Candidatus Omnitrophus magneticus TaxID=1609969 RepID=A0A0F0CS00_9BACT|nr:protein containing DUF11 [Candidatus Omnitrophus magneticus]